MRSGSVDGRDLYRSENLLTYDNNSSIAYPTNSYVTSRSEHVKRAKNNSQHESRKIEEMKQLLAEIKNEQKILLEMKQKRIKDNSSQVSSIGPKIPPKMSSPQREYKVFLTYFMRGKAFSICKLSRNKIKFCK